MSDTLGQYVESCLIQWAQWSRDHNHLGFSSVTTIGRVMKEGAGASHPTSNRVVMPEIVFHVEHALLAMPELEREAIKLKYLKLYLTDNARARRLKMSRTQFNNVLTRARWFIRGRMS